jgi:hypothetical protein
MEQLPAKIRRRGTLKTPKQDDDNPGTRPAARTEHEMYLGTFFLVITWGKQVTDRQRDIPHLNLGTFILVKETPTPLFDL